MTRVLQHFHSNADRAYNTLHFAMQSRVPKGAFAPFGYPHIFVSADRKLAPSSSPSLPRKYKNRHGLHLSCYEVRACFCLAVYDFAQHDFFCSVADAIAASHPLHLLVCFQFLGDTLGNFHLCDNRIQPFLRLLIHICKI